VGDRWSPPGMQQHDFVQGSGWYRHQPYGRNAHLHADRLELKPTVGVSISPSMSREPSPQYEDALEGPTRHKPSDDGDVTIAANVPLPHSAGTPQTGRSPSPVPLQGPGAARNRPEDDGSGFGAENLSNCRPCLNLWVTL
jgi:hypothetical protein